MHKNKRIRGYAAARTLLLTTETNKFKQFTKSFISFKGKYFPERQLFLRSEGRVRFLTINSYFQMAMASALLISLTWGGITSYAYLTRDITLEQKNQQIANISADYNSLENDFSALEKEIERRAIKLEERQRFLETNIAGEVSDSEASNADIIEAAAPTLDDAISVQESGADTSFFEGWLSTEEENLAVVPTTQERREKLLARLQNLAQHQQDIADGYLASLSSTQTQIEALLKPTSLSSEKLLAYNNKKQINAVGGPYEAAAGFEAVFNAEDGLVFDQIIDNQERLKIVTMMLESFPAGEPAAKYYLSSKFGRRIDPIKKTWSNHYAVDLAGWPGTAIQATAPGKVVKAGWLGPYGRMVEIDHGNGFRTRYGHMRKLRVKKGDIVELGHRIGDMGKSGRVTDTHLHYEVWFDGKVIDPWPFIKAGKDVLEIQRKLKKTSEA
jgi:murein DD-endopeptidase MepM/ murein hydrolase activator NlpD